MNRRDFIKAATATGIALAIPVYDADGFTVFELLIVLAIITVGAIIVIKLYKLAKDKLYPPPPPPPQEPPPDHQREATVDAADSGLIYGIDYLDYHMPDGSLCTHFAQTIIQSASDADGPWTNELVRVWLSGTKMLVSFRDQIINGTLEKQPGRTTASATLATETSTSPRRFYRTTKP